MIISIFDQPILMHCLHTNNDDPFFNLAAEEYFLRYNQEEYFLLWISKPAVIIGKHQCAPAEINHAYVHDHHIMVARRLSGGGTVYHDGGNINFTFITNEEPGKLIDFTRYIKPVIAFLELLGIKALQGEKNEILIHGLKISGNAEHVYKNRVLHHGTLLFNSNLENLGSALSENTGRYSGRAVQSNRARVANLTDFLEKPLTIGQFSDLLIGFIKEKYQGRFYSLDEEERTGIKKLAEEKYATWEWVYGYSPDYRFANVFDLKGWPVIITFHCRKGIIHNFEVQSEIENNPFRVYAPKFNGCRHSWEEMQRIVQRMEPGDDRDKTIIRQIMTSLF
jgi:lipoate---protein ligase